MKIKSTVLFFFLFLLASSAIAEEVRVREVKLSLFNKPVTGYRMVLDRSVSQVSSKIIKHVSRFDAQSFEFEKTVIFENILYPPVTKSRNISLYFLLNELPGNYSELTVVAMYDYRNSINSLDYPDLAVKLIADLSFLIRDLNGNDLKFEGVVFTSQTAEKLVKNVENRKEQRKSDNTVEHFREEEVENNDVLIKKDPFAESDSAQANNLLMLRLASKIREMEEEERRLAATEDSLKMVLTQVQEEKKYMDDLNEENSSLRDSVKQLSRRLNSLTLSELTGDELSLSGGSDAVAVLEDKLQNAKNRNLSLSASVDSLKTIMDKMKSQMKVSVMEARRLESELRESRAVNSRIKADYVALKTSVTQGSGSENLMSDLETENKSLKKRLNELRAEVATSEDAGAGTSALLDTIRDLRFRLSNAQDNAQPSLASDESGNQELLKEIRSLKAENSNLEQSRKELTLQLENAVATLKDLKNASSQTLNNVESYNERIDQLEENLKFTNQKIITSRKEIISLQDSLSRYKVENRRLKAELNEPDTEADNLRKKITQLENVVDSKDRSLITKSSEIDKLKSRISILSDTIRSLKKQDNLSDSDLREELNEQQQELAEKKRQLDEKEKLLGARENNLAEQQKRLKQDKEKYADIVEREQQLKLLEQRLRNEGADEILKQMKENPSISSSEPKGSSGLELVGPPEFGTITEMNGEIDVLKMQVDAITVNVERQIAGNMLKDGFLYDEKFPDLLYESVKISTVSAKPLKIRFRLQQEGTNTVVIASFRTPNGEYVRSDNLKSFLRSLIERPF